MSALRPASVRHSQPCRLVILAVLCIRVPTSWIKRFFEMRLLSLAAALVMVEMVLCGRLLVAGAERTL
jgi:hypothetical protein